MNSPDYSKMTNEDFDSILERIVHTMSAATILSYGDVHAILREELNNDVLEAWERDNPHLARPDNYPADCAEIAGSPDEGWNVETFSGQHKIASKHFDSLGLAEMYLDEIRASINATLETENA